QARRHAGCPFEVGTGIRGHSERGKPLESSFSRSSHRAAIENVGSEIQAVVEARDDQVGLAGQNSLAMQRHVDAVSGGAVDGKLGFTDLHQPERTIEAERVTSGALLDIRRTKYDVRPGSECFLQQLNSARTVPIIIAEKHE